MSDASPLLRRIITGVTALRRAPAGDAPLETQLLFGEMFSVEEEAAGWARGRSVHDDYPGYVQTQALGPPGPPPTHTVIVPRTFVYRGADIKSPPLLWLSMNARLALSGHRAGFSLIGDLGWVYSAHVAPADAYAADFVSVAEVFLGTPYLWGGRDSLGVDCSGLLQTAMWRAGLGCPRDTHQQVDLGEARPISFDALQRGDLIFWKGHVGIMRDASNLLHANAFHMQVAGEPLSEAVRRIAQSGGEVSHIRRLPKLGG